MPRHLYILALLALSGLGAGLILVLPALGFFVGFAEHTNQAKRIEFCVSCHVMEPYGRSLLIDSVDHLPANHFQNARVDQAQACFV